MYIKQKQHFPVLKRHGDIQTHNLSNIEFLHNFHIFSISYKKMNFRKMTCSKVNKSNQIE